MFTGTIHRHTIITIQICNDILPNLPSGQKVLDHSQVFIRDFLRSPFSMLIHTILAWMLLLSATLRQGMGRGDSILRQEFGITIPSHNWQKNFILVLLSDEWSSTKRGGPMTFCPDCRFIYSKIISKVILFLSLEAMNHIPVSNSIAVAMCRGIYHHNSCYIRHSDIFLFIDWLKVRHVIKNKLTILKKLGQSRK